MNKIEQRSHLQLIATRTRNIIIRAKKTLQKQTEANRQRDTTGLGRIWKCNLYIYIIVTVIAALFLFMIITVIIIIIFWHGNNCSYTF